MSRIPFITLFKIRWPYTSSLKLKINLPYGELLTSSSTDWIETIAEGSITSLEGSEVHNFQDIRIAIGK